MAEQGIGPGVWCGAWVKVAVGFGCVLGVGDRSSSGLASAHP